MYVYLPNEKSLIVKKLILLSAFSLLAVCAFAQPDFDDLNIDPDAVFFIVEEEPQFPGGEDKLNAYLKNNMNYPKRAIEDGEEGTVVVSFVVNKDGVIEDPWIYKRVSPALDKEALRLVILMPPWTPGRQYGRDVNVKVNLPIKFKIPGK